MLPEILLLIFGFEALILLVFLYFLNWKVGSQGLAGLGAAKQHVQWFLIRVIVFLYIAGALFVSLFVLTS